MRILLVAESFLPHMNGVTGSVLRVLDEFAARGDDLVVVAPRQRGAERRVRTACGRSVPVRLVPSLPLAGYADVRIAATSALALRAIMQEVAPDVVHLASPAVLGSRALAAAERLHLPTVAVHQTDVPGYTAKYGVPFLEAACWQLMRDLHNRATLTLAPSTAALTDLQEHGIQRVHLWRRGVDTTRFSPTLRSEAVRRRLGGTGEKLVVYVGRLAPEKQVEDLRVIHDLPGVRLVIVGDGPQREALRRRLPRARFLGFRSGGDLASIVASCDLFVHPGELETFCQGIQEAMASGLPVIAPRRGGPVDLVSPSRTGWLYTPGMLDELREAACDLLFDDAKRRAVGEAARESVRERTWPVLADQLRGHYRRAIQANALQRRPRVHTA